VADDINRPNPLRKHREPCAVDGCEVIAKHNDLCQLHYGRWHRKGSALWQPPVGNVDRVCEVADCDSRVHSRGYCSLHFSRWRHKGDASWVPVKVERPVVLCGVDGCSRVVNARGLCKTHRSRQRAHGDPTINRQHSPSRKEAVCTYCHRTFMAAKGAKFCGDLCARRHKTGRTTTANCSECAVHFERRPRSTSPCCSDECRVARLKRLIRAKNEERKATIEYHEGRRLVQQRRRARIRSALVESFTFLEIAERDGWVCGLCSAPVVRELRYPDPHSPTIDHVIPLAKGGPHTRGNVQLAHLRCNISKGARTALSTAA